MFAQRHFGQFELPSRGGGGGDAEHTLTSDADVRLELGKRQAIHAAWMDAALLRSGAFGQDVQWKQAQQASLRFPGPETIVSKIFARLSAWQNWIFQRPNAVGDGGALELFGTGKQPKFDRRRV